MVAHSWGLSLSMLMVQWALGKMEKEGVFLRTGTPNKPPPPLLNAQCKRSHSPSIRACVILRGLQLSCSCRRSVKAQRQLWVV
jgi:hypothetical protein